MLKFQKAILTGIAIGAVAAVGSGQIARAIPYPIAIAGDNTGGMNVNWTGPAGQLSINIVNGFLKSNCNVPFNNNVTISMPPEPAAAYHWNAATGEFDQEIASGPPLTITDNVTHQPYLICNFAVAVLHGVNGSSSASLTLEQDSVNYGMGQNTYFPLGVPLGGGSLSIEFVTLNPIVAGAGGINAFTANDGVTFGVQTPSAPPQVTGLVATAGNTTVNLTWNNFGPGVTYTVERSLVNGGPYTTIISGLTAPAYLDAGLTNGVTYYYVVNATNCIGTGPNSAQVSARPLPPIPAAPAGLSAITGPAHATLNWTASAGATSYNLARSLVNGGPYTVIVSGLTGTTYINTGLTVGTPYYYVVTATNLGGTSGNSNQSSAIPYPLAPTGLTATAGANKITLAWTASTGATSYNVYRSLVTGGPYSPIASGITAVTYTNTGLTTGTTYFYIVTAIGAGGESWNSKEASATSL